MPIAADTITFDAQYSWLGLDLDRFPTTNHARRDPPKDRARAGIRLGISLTGARARPLWWCGDVVAMLWPCFALRYFSMDMNQGDSHSHTSAVKSFVSLSTANLGEDRSQQMSKAAQQQTSAATSSGLKYYFDASGIFLDVLQLCTPPHAARAVPYVVPRRAGC